MIAHDLEGVWSMQDFGVARGNMIESQVRTAGVTDARLIAAMSDVAREAFVPQNRRAVAYMDDDLMVGRDALGRPRYLLEPMALARLLQLAEVKPDDRVLDVAVATGYSTAVLSRLAAQVTALEEDEALAATARETLAGLGAVEVVRGRHAEGHAAGAPYDVILVNGRLPEVPQHLVRQLSETGRLVLAVGAAETAPATVVMRSGKATSHRRWFDLSIPEAPGFPDTAPRFNF
jgi:protein-L-isoaspartate(D-aspartate) O-methyltransferase